jgi:hypothetical protein
LGVPALAHAIYKGKPATALLCVSLLNHVYVLIAHFVLLSIAFENGVQENTVESRLIQIFGGFFLPVLFMLLFALNMRAWTNYHVNYKFIFELDPRDHLDYYQFLEVRYKRIILSVW